MGSIANAGIWFARDFLVIHNIEYSHAHTVASQLVTILDL